MYYYKTVISNYLSSSDMLDSYNKLSTHPVTGHQFINLFCATAVLILAATYSYLIKSEYSRVKKRCDLLMCTSSCCKNLQPSARQYNTKVIRTVTEILRNDFQLLLQIQYNLNGSNTDGSFTMDDSNSFFSPNKILPIAHDNKQLMIFFLILS